MKGKSFKKDNSHHLLKQFRVNTMKSSSSQKDIIYKSSTSRKSTKRDFPHMADLHLNLNQDNSIQFNSNISTLTPSSDFLSHRNFSYHKTLPNIKKSNEDLITSQFHFENLKTESEILEKKIKMISKIGFKRVTDIENILGEEAVGINEKLRREKEMRQRMYEIKYIKPNVPKISNFPLI